MTPFVEFRVLCSVAVISIFVISFSLSSLMACNLFFVLIKSEPSFVFLHVSTSPSQAKSIVFLITNGETFSKVLLSFRFIVMYLGSPRFVLLDFSPCVLMSGGSCMFVIVGQMPAVTVDAVFVVVFFVCV